MTTYKFHLPWYCPECKIHGRVYFNDGIDIWLIMDKISENHRKASPTCTIWWSYIKIGEQNDTVSDTVKSNTR
jgi:hypothetical protein